MGWPFPTLFGLESRPPLNSFKFFEINMVNNFSRKKRWWQDQKSPQKKAVKKIVNQSIKKSHSQFIFDIEGKDLGALTLKYNSTGIAQIGFVGNNSIENIIRILDSTPVNSPNSVNGISTNPGLNDAIYQSFGEAPVLFSSINYRASTVEQLNNPINLLTYEINGNIDIKSFKPSTLERPSQFQEDLQTIEKEFFIGPFSGIYFNINANTSVEMTLTIKRAFNRNKMFI